jgi:hypothetical protein
LASFGNKLSLYIYYACFHAKADYSIFMNATAAIALKMTPEDLLS